MEQAKYLANLKNLFPVIYPSFHMCITRSSEELVFLNIEESSAFKANEVKTALEGVFDGDKTLCEATINHFHLFDNVGVAGRTMAVAIGKAIAQNLLSTLTQIFPTKKFVVYLQLNINDSTIIRFHQKWQGEHPYFDTTSDFEDGTELYRFESGK